jgi:hypothetical protein
MRLAQNPASTGLDDARSFLARVVPWGDGYVNLHWRFQGEGYDRPGWGGRATRTLDEALGSLRFQLNKPTTLDIYVCMSAQREAIIREHGNRHWAAALRSGPNAVALRSLFVDVDVKEGGYPSTREALSAVHVFCASIGLLLPTTCVQTGSGGLHCYWTLETPLPPQEWLPLAHALANATKVKGLRCDTQCTVDTARILRVPQTFNYKNGVPGLVKLGPIRDYNYSVEQLWSALEPFKVATPRITPLANLPARAPLEGENELGAGVEALPPLEIDLRDALPECGFLRTAVATGGKTYNNALWMYTTLLATFTKQKERAAHVMANGHPGYSQESTQELYERKLKDRADRGLGWPACATIAAGGSTACPTCPHLAKGRTPFHYARPQPQPNVAPSNNLPPFYEQTPEGRIAKRTVLPDGSASTRAITDFTMDGVWIQDDPCIFHFSSRTVATGQKTHAIEFEEIHGDALGKRLMGMGLPTQTYQLKEIRELLVSWINHLQQSKGNVVKSMPYGWYPDKGKPTGFTFGGKTFSKGSVKNAASGDHNISRQFAPIGDKQPWIDAAKFITDQGRQDLCAILATAFAGPLLRLIPVRGVVVSGYSRDSGIGKTTTMEIAQSVWGNPKAMQGLTDSSKSVLFKMGELRNIPVFWDELQNQEHTKAFVNVIFSTTQGREGSRLTRSVTLRQAGEWETMMVVCANNSVSDAIAQATTSTTAGVNRVFEFRVKKVGQRSKFTTGEATQITGVVNENYGNVGVEYAKWLGEHPDEIKTIVQEQLISLQKEVKEETEERLWTAAMTTILLGARFANELGFTDFDLAALKGFLIGVLQEQRADRANAGVDMNKELNISNVLQQFLKATSVKHTVHTNIVHTGQGKPAKGSINVLGDTSRVDSAQVHIGRDDALLRISGPFFNKWIKDHGYSAFSIRKAMEEKFAMHEVIGRIGAGTDKASKFAERLYEIDLSSPQLQGIVEH